MSARVAGDAALVEAIRARANKGKEAIGRDMAQDGRLSMKARGILTYLLSKPDKWRTNAQSIAGTCEKDGRDAISSGLKELEELGYLARKRRQDSLGKWVWSWVYSDDPAEVRAVLDEMFPAGDGVQTDARRGRARAANPQVRPINGFPVYGSPVDGSPVDGKPGDIELQERDLPPTPPLRGGPDDLSTPERCGAHGRTRCRPCGLSPRVQAQAARQRVSAELIAREAAGQSCSMCRPDGERSDGGGTRWIRVTPGTQQPITPYRVCDHRTPHAVIVDEMRAREAAAESARAGAARAAATLASGEPRSAPARSGADEQPPGRTFVRKSVLNAGS